MTAYASEEEVRIAVAEAQARLERTGQRMSAGAEAALIAALSGGVAEEEYVRLDACAVGWELE